MFNNTCALIQLVFVFRLLLLYIFYFVHYEWLEWAHIFSKLDFITLDIKIKYVNHSTASTTLVEHKNTLETSLHQKWEKYMGTQAMMHSMR